jgi:ABC-2 type transport system permease protein
MGGSVLAKTLRDQRRWLLAWTIVIVAVGVLYAAFWPLMGESAMRIAIEAFPEELLEALGYDDLATAAGYIGSTTFGLLGPALIIIFSGATGTAAVAGEEEAGRLDLLLAHPVSRWSLLLQRCAALVIAILLPCLVLALALVAIAGPTEVDIDAAHFAAASLHLAVFGIFFGTLALGIGAASGRRGVAWALVALLAIGGYIAANVAPLVGGLEWLETISPFHYYNGGAPLRNGVQPADLAVLLVLSVGFVALGGWRLDRRDIAV